MYLGEEKGKKRKIKGVGINGARRGRGGTHQGHSHRLGDRVMIESSSTNHLLSPLSSLACLPRKSHRINNHFCQAQGIQLSF